MLSLLGKKHRISEKFVYFGNLLPEEEQFRSDRFIGLALSNPQPKDLIHDIRQPLPFVDGTVPGFQSQDVFEHVEAEIVPSIFDEIYRCLIPGGAFRLSLPDYNSPLLKSRSVYDSDGNILGDLALGASVTGVMSGGVEVQFAPGGDAHLWFPTYAKVLELILKSLLRKCSRIDVRHAWIDRSKFICEDFDHSLMPVKRVPPKDMRAQGRPISIVVDFVK
jgi:SAM-dependent methyltransferase